ncbi:MAG: hypothetical protein ACT443_07290 [Gemmatimonadota bacterium]
MRVVFRFCLFLLMAGCDGERRDAGEQAAPDSVTAQAAAASDTGVKACDLVTVDEIRAATGLELKPGITTSDYMGVSQCRFDRPDGSRTGLMIALHGQGDIENYRRVPGSSEVAALGTAAVWNAQTNQLAVRSGDAVFSISFLFSPARQAWAEQLARDALEGLEEQ